MFATVKFSTGLIFRETVENAVSGAQRTVNIYHLQFSIFHSPFSIFHFSHPLFLYHGWYSNYDVTLAITESYPLVPCTTQFPRICITPAQSVADALHQRSTINDQRSTNKFSNIRTASKDPAPQQANSLFILSGSSFGVICMIWRTWREKFLPGRRLSD